MAVFPIRTFGDPVLRRKAEPVDSVGESVRKLVEDLFDTMDDAPGIGLAAPQIGVSKRVVVYGHSDVRGALINPRIVKRQDSVSDDEGCLSLPGLSFPIDRARLIEVEALDENGDPVAMELEDLSARIIQHEIDHLDGVLFIDHLPDDLQKEAKSILRHQVLSGEVAQVTAPVI